MFLLLCSRRTRIYSLVLGCSLLTGGIRSTVPSEAKLSRGEFWVRGQVETWQEKGRLTFGTMQVYRVGERHYSTPVKLRFSAWDCKSSPSSEWVTWKGKVEPTQTPSNPGERQLQESGRFSARGEPRWGPGDVSWIKRFRHQFVSEISERYPGWAGRLGEAMLLGNGRALRPTEVAMFRRSGLAHLTAVSGLHVGFVFVLALGIFSFLPYAWRCLLATGIAFAFAGLAGFPPSACRAATLMGLGLCGGALGRSRESHEWVILAVLWITWVEPEIWTRLSFQLSICAVMGILISLEVVSGFNPRWRRILMPPGVSLGAQWGTLPWSLHAFGMLPVFSLLPNLVAVPLAGLFVPALGLSLAVPQGSVLFSVGKGAAQAAAAGIGWIARVSSDHLLCLEILPRPHEWMIVVFIAVGILRFLKMLPGRSFLILSALATGLLLIPWGPPPGPWVCFLDVGQGDAAVFRLADGSIWLVDAGDDRGPSNAVSRVVGPFLRERRIRHLDGVVLSHPHRDHTGALQFLWGRVRIDTVYVSPCFGAVPIADQRVHLRRVQAGESLGRGGRVKVLHPGNCDSRSVNNASLVLDVRDGPMVLLLTGDLEAGGEMELLETGQLRPATILKAGHHGSSTSSTAEFLRQVRPQLSIISCGRFNTYGHPDSTVVSRLGEMGDIYRTDRSGAVDITYSGEKKRVVVYGGQLVPP